MLHEGLKETTNMSVTSGDATVKASNVSGVARAMPKTPHSCHEQGPPGKLQRWNCKWDEKHLGIERDFELRGMAKRRLLRLRPDYKDNAGWKPQTRVEFMTIAAREALRNGNCEVVGGFIRDWVIRGEVDAVNGTPKDIDLRLWKGFDLEKFVERCGLWGMVRDDRGKLMGFRTPFGDWFFIDYIWRENFEQGGDLSIDLDVNSFAVSNDLGLHKRAYMNRPICKTFGNMERKVAYLIENDPKDGRCTYMKQRVYKMEKRGWRVIRAMSLEENCACKA